MSQNKKTVCQTVLSALLLGALAMPVTANAAVSTPQGRSVVYKTSLSTVEGLEARVLDWRNPSLEFTFDASDTDWTDGLELLLSADPLGKVSPHTPLMVQFNNGKPMPVNTRGQGFDARIKLEAARIRPFNNKIRFTYETPTGAACLTPQHGGWRLDFKNSHVIIKARAKVRNYQLREVEARLLNPTTAPNSVRLLARGQNTAKLQALAAQGVGLRMKSVPEFKTTSGGSEFDVILGRRDQLYSWVSDKKILEGAGPRVLVHKGRPMRLVITGDTDAEVMATAKAFATYQLPDAHRSMTSLGEMNMQTALGFETNRIDGTAKLIDLNGGYFDHGWGPKPQTIKFDVSDPKASTGEVLLRIGKDKTVANSSRLSVNLNGKSLGYAALNKSRKSVAFKIPAGTLQGTDNTLSLTPELDMRKVSGCNFTEELPGFYLGDGSKLKIKTDTPSPVAELSKMTATGAPFSLEKAANTVVMLPATSSRDYNASLKILAKLAKSSGHGWTEANYLRSANFAAIGTHKNVLVIGPNAGLNKTIRDGAPVSLKSALKGQSLNGTGRVASIDRFAASDEQATLRLYAERQAGAGRIRNGGVAALYPSPLSGSNVMGVITNVPGRSFSSVAGQFVKPHAWNNMEGSVARWDGSKVIMAQTAMAIPGFIGATPKKSKIGGFKLPEFNLPKLDFEAFEFGEIDMSTLRMKFENFKESAASLLGGAKTDKVVTPRVNPTVKLTPVPKLRGMYKVPEIKKPNAALAGLKTWTANTQKIWQNFNLGNSVRAVQTKTKPMGDTIKAKFEGTKLATWSEQNLSSPAIMLIAALAFLFLLLGLAKPNARSARRR